MSPNASPVVMPRIISSGLDRIHDHLLTRLSNDDDLERNLSTFASEMASTAMILGWHDLNGSSRFIDIDQETRPRDGELSCSNRRSGSWHLCGRRRGHLACYRGGAHTVEGLLTMCNIFHFADEQPSLVFCFLRYVSCSQAFHMS